MGAITAPQSVDEDELEILYQNPGRCVFARSGNVALQVWFARSEQSDAVALRNAGEKLHAMYPGGVSTVHWLFNVTELPDAATRKVFTEVLGRRSNWFGEVAIVVDGEGFWLSAVRGMLTGIRIAAGARVGFRVAQTIDEMLRWLPDEHQRRTGVHVDGAVLKRTLLSLAQAHAPQHLSRPE